jgi:hypothetical protein
MSCDDIQPKLEKIISEFQELLMTNSLQGVASVKFVFTQPLPIGQSERGSNELETNARTARSRSPGCDPICWQERDGSWTCVVPSGC